ncbi:PREDICTED: probable salivary secreted peptide [Wasmannia auropunctata]|uniref:probable salivary secreted peptide n=1 Tax=Wasmannia auropunctata TaxID=64793 RepID=UPI0005ED5B06|nr:PREDICTED: probable salivary secreted peptide [Wasmannia auropunctata]
MSVSKYIISLAVLVLALLTITTVPANGAVDYYAPPNRSLTIGYRMPGDRLVYRESIVKNAGWMKIQIIEKTFKVSKYERLTMIQSLDQNRNGTGANVNVLKGGPGYNNVTLRFKSQRGYNISHIVQLYARP